MMRYGFMRVDIVVELLEKKPMVLNL